jgi:hypothetical protein
MDKFQKCALNCEPNLETGKQWLVEMKTGIERYYGVKSELSILDDIRTLRLFSHMLKTSLLIIQKCSYLDKSIYKPWGSNWKRPGDW